MRAHASEHPRLIRTWGASAEWGSTTASALTARYTSAWTPGLRTAVAPIMGALCCATSGKHARQWPAYAMLRLWRDSVSVRTAAVAGARLRARSLLLAAHPPLSAARAAYIYIAGASRSRGRRVDVSCMVTADAWSTGRLRALRERVGLSRSG